MLKLAGAEGLEPSTVGFGDRCSTIGTMLLQKVAKLYSEKSQM